MDKIALDLRCGFIVQQHKRFLVPQDGNAPKMLLTTPPFKTSTPMVAQMSAGTFAI